MRVRLLCVGKPRDPLLARLHDEYADRIRRLGVDYATASVAEARTGGRLDDEPARRREATALLEKADPRGTRVAVDPSGGLLTSEALAGRLERWAVPAVTFLVGGPRGHSTDLISRCHEAWSLSPLTFTHEMVRVLLAEQVYRALTLLRGIPYHR